MFADHNVPKLLSHTFNLGDLRSKFGVTIFEKSRFKIRAVSEMMEVDVHNQLYLILM